MGEEQTRPMSENTSPTDQLTDEEQALVRRAAFSAIALVSRADPGFFSMFKESMAGSRAFTEAPAGVQELLREGGFPTPPTGSPEEVEQTTLSELGQAVQILQAKAPAQAQGFTDVVLAAADRVAQASDGVAPEEQEVIDRIRAALQDGGAGEAVRPAEQGGAVQGDGPYDSEQDAHPDLPPSGADQARPGTPGADPGLGDRPPDSPPGRPGPLG